MFLIRRRGRLPHGTWPTSLCDDGLPIAVIQLAETSRIGSFVHAAGVSEKRRHDLTNLVALGCDLFGHRSRVYHGRGEKDICGEAVVGFVCAHGDAFEFLELAEEVFDQVAPLVDFRVDRQRRGAPWMLRDDDLGVALAEVGDDGIAVKGLIGDEPSKVRPSMSGATPTVSKRCPGRRTKRTRLPNASVSARILVVMPPSIHRMSDAIH
jgi:hypothetical protein